MTDISGIAIREFLGAAALDDGSGARIALGGPAAEIHIMEIGYLVLEQVIAGLEKAANESVDRQMENGTLQLMPGRAYPESGVLLPDLRTFGSFRHGTAGVIHVQVQLPGPASPPVSICGQVDRAGLQAARDDLTETLWELHQREAGLN